MARKKLERDIERDCVLIAEAAGWKVKKLDKNDRDWPDRAFFGPDAFTWIVEFKRPGEEPRARQEKHLDEFDQLGFATDVIDNVDAFREKFRYYNAGRYS